MTTLKRCAVTILLTQEHLRKLIEDHLLQENKLGDRPHNDRSGSKADKPSRAKNQLCLLLLQ